MSKYLGNKPFFQQNINTEGRPILKPTINDETKNFIFSNISSGNYTLLYDKISSGYMNLSFNDNDNNSVIHILLKVDNKLIPENTKIKLLKFFIQKGAPVNSYNKDKMTPLHIAINNGDSKIVKFLLDNGSNPQAKTYNNITPIQLALNINTEVCKDNIVPKNISDIETKDKNKLKNKIVEKVKENFNKDYFIMFCKIFEDYKIGYNNLNIVKTLYTEIIEITKDSKYNDADLKLQINNKIEQNIKLIIKEMGEIDSVITTRDIISFINTPDSDIICTDYENGKTMIKALEGEIDDLYNTKLQDLKDLKLNSEKYFYDYFNNFCLQLICLSNHIFSEDTTNNKIRLFNITAKNRIEKDYKIFIMDRSINMNPLEITNIYPHAELNQEQKNIKNNTGANSIELIDISTDIAPKIKLGNIIVYNIYLNSDLKLFEETLNNLYKNFIKTMKLPSKPNTKINTMINDLIKLKKINDILQLIDFDSFNILNNSYKFKLLNYLKMCNIISNISNIQPEQTEIKKDDPNINILLEKKFLTGNNDATTGPLTSINKLTDYAAANDLNNLYFNIFEYAYNLSTPRQKIDELNSILNPYYNKLLIGIQLEDINNYTCTLDIIDKFNEINKLKYHAKYVQSSLMTSKLVTPVILPEIDNLEVYFDKRISKNLNLQAAIKYKDGTDKEYIVTISDPSKIYAIADDLTSSYNEKTISEGSFKLFSDREIGLIKSLISQNILSNQIIERDKSINIYTVGRDSITLLKVLIIKDIYDKIKSNPNIIGLLKEYNKGGIEESLILDNIIINITNEIIDELLKYYKMNYAKEIIKEIIKTSNIKSDFMKDANLGIDIKKLLGIDFKNININKNNFFIDESTLDNKYYNYNYRSNDEALLCYKNNKDIIITLLENGKTEYLKNDIANNNILHYLVNVENYKLFRDIFLATPSIQSKFCKMIKLENNAKKNPLDFIKYKIEYNDNQFYKIVKKIPSDTELIFADSFSDDLIIKVTNNNELFSIIPTSIKNIFNDIYVIFNIDKINDDIIIIDDLNDTFTYDKKLPKVMDSPINDIDNICKEYYDFLQKRNNKDKYLETNDYYKRFYNTIAHAISLHFSSTFFILLKELLLIEPNMKILGMSNDNFKELKDTIFNFDPTFKEPNLAQLIILNIYKIKYNEDIIENKSLSSLKEILKFKLTILNTIIIDDKMGELNENIEKIYDYMNIFFDTFNKKIILFLTNYVKFIELQYNLQQIKNLLQDNS